MLVEVGWFWFGFGEKLRFWFCTVRLSDSTNDNVPARGALPLTTRRLPEQAPWVDRQLRITERGREREMEGGKQTVTAPANDSSKNK